MTIYAREIIEQCDVVVGYETYIDLIAHLLKPSQEVLRAGMTEEVYRAQKAVELARGKKRVGIISSGDSGLYGMAGLIYEVIDKMNSFDEIDVEIVPGVTALISAASLLGSPIMHDFCAVSLSDHLTPWQTIEKRLELAALGDFVVALYNPKSGRRKEQIVKARDLLLKYRQPENPVGIVSAAYRSDQSIIITDIEHMLDHPITMMTTVIIGNSTTYVSHGKMITPRGYEKKYDLDKSEQNIKITERMNSQHEPWSLRNSPNSDGENQTGAVFKPIENTPYLRDDEGDEGAVIVKKCNFCEGDKIESLPWLNLLNQILFEMNYPGQLHIGFNGCGRSCHGAVMEDIGVVYFRGEFEVYVGGKRMGRNVRLPLFTHLHLTGDEMISVVKNVVKRYQGEAFQGEKFFKYILRISGKSEQTA
jgi:precorrin-3B C17-methyltransferase